MTYNQVSHVAFMNVMQKLTSTPLPTKVAYQIKRISEGLQQVRNRISDEYETEILNKFAKKNEDGSIFRPDGQGPNGFEIPDEQKAAFQEAQEKFGLREFTLDRFPVPLSALETMRLSVGELTHLEPIYTVEEQPTPVVGGHVLPLKA
jgi:hypothetical protein